MNRITVDFTKTHQEIDGFGVHGAFHQARNLRRYPDADQQRVLDVLFSTEDDGAGFSVIRNIIGDSGVWGNEKDGPIPSIEPQKGEVNLEGDEDQLWFMREAQKRGCQRFVSTAWSPPAWMKTTGEVANGGSLKAACYADFAEYLARYVKIYREHHGIEIYAVSPANEPDLKIHYSSCVWSGDQLCDFYKNYLGPVFAREKVLAKTFGPELMKFGNASLKRYDALLQDRDAMGALDILAIHGYEDSVIEPIDQAYSHGKKTWMSELCGICPEDRKELDPSIEDGLAVAKKVHEYLTVAGVSAFLYFWGMTLYPNNSALIHMNLDDLTTTICKRAYTIGHFSRFIRPGSVRVEAVSDAQDGVFVSAYRGTDGEAVVVVLNTSGEDASLSLSFEGSAPATLTAYVTDRDRNLHKADSPVPVLCNCAQVTVAANSIMTFTGKH